MPRNLPRLVVELNVSQAINHPAHTGRVGDEDQTAHILKFGPDPSGSLPRPRPSRWMRRRPHLAPEMRAHLRVLVEHHPIEIDAAQRIRVVGAVELDARPVGEVDAELGLVDLPVRDRLRVLLEVVPGDLLGLAVERRDLGVARVPAGRAHRVVDELVDAEHRLAEAAVTARSSPKT